MLKYISVGIFPAPRKIDHALPLQESVYQEGEITSYKKCVLEVDEEVDKMLHLEQWSSWVRNMDVKRNRKNILGEI